MELPNLNIDAETSFPNEGTYAVRYALQLYDCAVFLRHYAVYKGLVFLR